MPDLDLLPPGHALPAVPRPPAGLVDVLARATRRRRRQQAGALATGAAACAAFLAFTMTTGSAVDSLGVTPAHPGRGVVPTETPRVDSPDVPAPPAVDPASESAPAPAGNAPGNTSTTDGGRKQATTGTTTTAQQNTSSGEVGPPHTTTAYDPSRACTGAAQAAPTGWCGYYDGATSGRAGQRVELAETLCRLPGQGEGTLTADTGQQAEFSVISKDNWPKWRWSKGHRFSKKGSTFRVAAGTCVRWHVSWNVVDDAGRPLTSGAYTLDARPRAYPPDDNYVYSNAAAFVTFTVL